MIALRMPKVSSKSTPGARAEESGVEKERLVGHERHEHWKFRHFRNDALSLSLSLSHREIEYLASVNFLFSHIRRASVMPDVSPLETLIALDSNERYRMSVAAYVKIKMVIRNVIIYVLFPRAYSVLGKSCVSSNAGDIKIACYVT